MAHEVIGCFRDYEQVEGSPSCPSPAPPVYMLCLSSVLPDHSQARAKKTATVFDWRPFKGNNLDLEQIVQLSFDSGCQAVMGRVSHLLVNHAVKLIKEEARIDALKLPQVFNTAAVSSSETRKQSLST